MEVTTHERQAPRPNCGLCSLCEREPESATHMLFRCRFSTRIWNMIKDWMELTEIEPTTWVHIRSVEQWWTSIILAHGHRKMAIASLAMLVAWELWKKRNARVFRNVATMPTIIMNKIKIETTN
ncbi:hypothetical protein BRADI_5g10411v3 [Brachypodium distachyon]|uniref:Reverse transcriptase zinc-binding domain-containing protein n=1 Tax=Brachypodium distachyon TaxID=15368 RepID=A0A2K2CGE5_BRADI|nr:hypothetical protein BRADI_5g10411v3 [Brachypodium distachyon]